MLAFVGRTEGKAQLWVRPLGESESRLLPGSEGAYNPFWSPDSRWIAFFTPLKLKKIEVANGAVIDLCDMGFNNKGSWGSRGVILLASVGLRLSPPIQRVSDAGGSPMPVPEAAGRDPRFLPDGRRFVYARGALQSQDLWLASLDPVEKPRRVGEAGEQPTYSAGHILSVVNGILVARPFDLARGEFRGESFPLKAPLARRRLLGYLLTDFSANAQGMLVYPPQTNSVTELRWRDRTGKPLGSLGAPGEYDTPRISPDGRRVAFSRMNGDNSDIWVANPDADSFTRLTFDPAIDENPVWSADGAALTFANNASGNANLYRKAATGAGTIDRLTTNTVEEQPLDWSRDGRFLLYTQLTKSTEIMIQAASGGKPLSFLGHARGASKAQFNPSVPRWIAYDFDDSGRREIYVQAFEPGKPASSARWQISNGGGMMPRWRGDGNEIFYLSLDGKMMAVRVSGDGAAFQSSTPRFLFNATPPHLRTPNFEYDVSPDGERFLMIEPLVAPEHQPLTLVSNWRSR
jgi:Tol biopolymer transport system component